MTPRTPARSASTHAARHLCAAGALLLAVAGAPLRAAEPAAAADDWYDFAPSSDAGPSVVGMEDWMDAPAGRHGVIQITDGHQVFADGTPAKLWGVGTQPYAAGLAPDHATATAFADWYRKWGVNSVRNGLLFGTGWMGIGDASDTTRLDPAQLERFDFSFSELKAKGVYYNLVAFWTEGLRPGDKPKVLAYDEARSHASELDTFAPDIQDLRIQAVVSFLGHENPYTHLRYADDAAISCLEIRNEQDVFWYTTPAVRACPTYLARINHDFCDWLRAKYGGADKLQAAWGPGAWSAFPEAGKDESLDANTITPVVNPWFFSPEGIASRPDAHQRAYDMAAFLYEVQNRYYQRFEKAVRAAGYKGLIIGSNWQTAGGITQAYNLLCDRALGRIDRHNYCGGASDNGMHVNVAEDDRSMLWRPGSCLLSTGFQQCLDRPFALTEWMDQAPNEWAAEGPPLIAFYGFGLQGWDAAYAGNNTAPRFDPTYGTWLHVQGPLDLGLYPAVARAIFRGDVAEGAVVAASRYTLAGLAAGAIDAADSVIQHGDNKEVVSRVPDEAIAYGRVGWELADTARPPLIPDLAAQLAQKVIRSTTKQLAWHYPSQDESYVTVDTAGTKGLFGFPPKDACVLTDARLQLSNRFAVLLVTALERGRSLADAKTALITAVARARNTGMAYGPDHRLIAIGKAPVQLEAVHGAVTLARPIDRVILLDHDGKPTGRTAAVSAGAITIDGTTDRTLYYEVVFK